MDYAEQVVAYRELVGEYRKEMKRVKIIGDRAEEFGYPFARGHVGYVVDNTSLKEHPSITFAVILTNGGRIWRVPEGDYKEE